MVKPANYTLPAILNVSVANYKNKIFATMGSDCVVTYGDFELLSNKLQNLFISYGIQQGEKIALISENMPNWGLSYFSIAKSGAVSVPILVDFSVKEINNILSHSESKIVIISRKAYNNIQTDLIFDGLIICINDFSDMRTGVSTDEMQASFVAKNGELNKTVVVEPNDLATIIYTSGTTGRSKGVMLSHENLVWDAYQCTTIYPADDSDVYLSVLPLAHTYECTLGLILGVMQGATTHYIEKAPTANVLMPLLKSIRPTMMLTVPLIIEKMYKVGIKSKFTKNRLMRFLYQIRPIQKVFHRIAGKKMIQIFGGRLRFFGIGGAAVAPEVEQFLRDAKFPYSCGYGLTETSPMIFGAPVFHTKFRSVGPVMNGVEARLINVNPTTGEGEVVVRGKNVMQGYYKEPTLTAEVLDAHGWFKTGDLGIIDKKGYLSLKGRSKNMILGASGENIYPEEIEAIINEIEGVVESVVYQHKGKLVAQVYLNKDEFSKKYQELLKSAQSHTDELKKRMEIYIKELKHKVNQSVGKHAQISDIKLTDEPFEKTATMKIKRFTLQKGKKEKENNKTI